MLDYLARLVNKKSRLERMKLPQTDGREVRKPTRQGRRYSPNIGYYF